MGFPIRKVETVATTGTLNGVVAGTRTPGATIALGSVLRGSLAVELDVDAETNTLVMFADWQVSDDASTWKVLAPANNAANVALATGTAGADASVQVVLEAPQSLYSFRYARCAIRNTVATGAAADTYSIKYHYLKPTMGAV